MLICKVIHTSQCPDRKGRVGYFWLIVFRDETGKLWEVEESPTLFANERRCNTAGENRLTQLEASHETLLAHHGITRAAVRKGKGRAGHVSAGTRSEDRVQQVHA